MTGLVTGLVLPDAAARADLATYLGRARRADPDGAVRLVAAGAALAVYVSPVHGGGGPTVLGLRVTALGATAELDATVPLAAVTDRLARLPDVVGPLELPVPPMHAQDAGWAGISPPRTGWQAGPDGAAAALREVAQAGIQEIAEGAPQGSGAAAVAAVRARAWGRPLDGVGGVPSGAAFAAQALGFLAGQGTVAVFRCGGWHRLTTPRGHVLVRRPLL